LSGSLLQSEARGLVLGMRGLAVAPRDLPKRPATPYNLFVAEQFPALKKNFPSLKAPEIMKKIGVQWGSTPKGRKDAMGSAYGVELAKWRKEVSALPEEVKEAAKQEKLDKKVQSSALELKRLVQSLGKPKKPNSAFLLFMAERRPSMPQGLKPTETISRMAAEWKGLPEKKKAIYERKAEELRAAHDKALRTWTAKMERQGKLQQVEEAEARVAALRSPTDPLAEPRRPPTSYSLYQDEKKRALPAVMAATDKNAKVAAEWKALAAGKRAAYEEKATGLKEEHEKEMRRWIARMEKAGRGGEVEAAKAKFAKVAVDPLAKPKRPLTAYGLYLEARLPKLPAAVAPQDRVRTLAAEWKALSEKKKAPYEARHAELRADYDRAVKRWSRKMDKLEAEA